MIKTLFSRVGLLLLAAGMFISPAATFAAGPPQWKVDRAQSRVEFASSFGGAPFTGQFRRWNARIGFDPADLAHSSVVAIIDLGSAATGDQSRDSALPEQDWFYVVKFPTAKFQSNRFRKIAANRYEAIGTLTLRGVSKPLRLPFDLVIKGNVAVMKARLDINRLAFGVGQGQFADPSSIPANVVLNLLVTARK